ncbi:MAG: ABC transporter ATP-binding protein [Thermodesulfobacteriota bacterium]
MEIMQGENLTKKYGQEDSTVTALKGISFQINCREWVAIMGESGSGKSTLLSIMGAMNTPTQGKYYVDKIDVYSLGNEERADFRRQYLGFVFQNFYLVPYLTLLENVMLPLATTKLKRKEKHELAQEALCRVGLDGKARRLPNQISGGEQQRVAIARAIVNRPPILLADEPTGNLDTKNSREVMNFLQKLNHEGMTIVMVTHNQDYAQYAGRIFKLADGILVEEIKNEGKKFSGQEV